jgi:hypothetical protein
MKRIIPLIICLALILCAGAAQAADEQQPFIVHFVVVPGTMPDGSDSSPAIMEFRKEVLKLAGGYTELGQSHGGSLHGGVVKQQENVSFIIGAKKDISPDLKAMTRKLFKGDGAFILSWPGKVIF